MVTYQAGTRFGAWSLYEEPQKGKLVFVIRRRFVCPGKKPKVERLDRNRYRRWENDPVKLKQLCLRLNYWMNRVATLKKEAAIKHAFISPVFLDEYKEHLITRIPTRRKAVAEHSYLVNYFLHFFITKLKLTDPLEWHEHDETLWATYLATDKDVPKSASVKKTIVRAANRFMLYLHKKRPREVPPLVFDPLTKPKLKKIEADRILAGQKKIRKYMPDKHWALIAEKLPLLAPNLEPFAMLAYHFGLRRAESLGLDLPDVNKTFLFLQKQLEKIPGGNPVYGPLKGREPRKIPYCFPIRRKPIDG